MGLNTLWIYTTLKQGRCKGRIESRLNTLWIYTTLKLLGTSLAYHHGLNTLWIYTTLKHRKDMIHCI